LPVKKKHNKKINALKSSKLIKDTLQQYNDSKFAALNSKQKIEKTAATIRLCFLTNPFKIIVN